MHFLLKCFCFFWILNHVRSESEVASVSESPFNIMALGHSGLLIFWDQIENNTHSFFVEYEAIGEGKQNSTALNLGVNGASQHMISSLVENTEYAIIIREYNNSQSEGEPINIYTLTGNTDLKTNSIPAKPAISIQTQPLSSMAEITWIPCGEERNCYGKTSGTHFFIKLRSLKMRHTTIINSKSDKEVMILFGSRVYEAVVTSVNGDFQTDSDPQEIYTMPFSSPVRSVKVLSLNESAVMIFWKTPKEYKNPVRYYFLNSYQRSMNSKDDAEAYTRFDCPTCSIVFVAASNLDYEAFIFLNLTAAAAYTFCIIPFGENENGIEYLINYTPPAFDDTLPVAMPDISYKIFANSQNTSSCIIKIRCLPCGETFDCKNTRPGDSYILEYKKATDSTNVTLSRRIVSAREEMSVEKNQSYNIKITSARGSDQSSTFSKTIEVDNLCKEIAETKVHLR